MLIKIDMKKAYNQMKWSFVSRVMDAWGFSSDFIKLILSCVEYVEFELLLNRNQFSMISLGRGLRQGDLCLLFFLSCVLKCLLA